MESSKLSVRIKFFSGLGAAADTIKDWAFANLVLFYFERIWGVPGFLVGLALFIAMCFDAITDPIVGSISDNWRSPRLGRRHPFMYAGPLPMAICLYLLFTPPATLGSFGMFLWLTTFAILVRTFMTVFVIPWTALQAELSQDYAERSLIVSYRLLIGWFMTCGTHFLANRFIFQSSPEFPNGLFNKAGYPMFAFYAGSAILLFTFLSTHFTRSEIPHFPVPAKKARPFSFGNVLRETKIVFSNRSFVILFLGIFIPSIFEGVMIALEVYVNVYFWGLRPEQIAWFGPCLLIGAVAGFVLVYPVRKRFEKKPVLFVAWGIWIIVPFSIISLRLIGWMLPNGHPLLLPLLAGNVIIKTGTSIMALTMWNSMIADSVDEHELLTEERQEGLFYSLIAFMKKAMTAVGILASGAILNLLSIPRTAAVETIDPGIIWNFGLVVGAIIPCGGFLGMWVLSRYDLKKARHAEIRAELEARTKETE